MYRPLRQWPTHLGMPKLYRLEDRWLTGCIKHPAEESRRPPGGRGLERSLLRLFRPEGGGFSVPWVLYPRGQVRGLVGDWPSENRHSRTFIQNVSLVYFGYNSRRIDSPGRTGRAGASEGAVQELGTGAIGKRGDKKCQNELPPTSSCASSGLESGGPEAASGKARAMKIVKPVKTMKIVRTIKTVKTNCQQGNACITSVKST